MSPGIRSGVNCTRLLPHRQRRRERAHQRVLATPGTPSSSTCPPVTQRDQQAGHGGVLADHRLGHLEADPVSVAGAVAVGSSWVGRGGSSPRGCSWVVYLSRGRPGRGRIRPASSSGPGGDEQVVHPPPGRTGAGGPPPSTSARRVAAREPQPRGQPARWPAEDPGGVRAVADPAVEPAAARVDSTALTTTAAARLTSGPSRRPRQSIVASTAAATSQQGRQQPGAGRAAKYPASPRGCRGRRRRTRPAGGAGPAAAGRRRVVAAVDLLVAEHVGGADRVDRGARG